MKNTLLDEFKVWLTDNGYERIDVQLNITQSAMFKAWEAAMNIGFDRGCIVLGKRECSCKPKK